MRPPGFWRTGGPLATLLQPLALAYGALVGWRLEGRPGVDPGVPVLCIGNPTLGGAGKTPVVLALAAMLQELGRTPHLLSRGYGGKAHGPLRVDPARHAATLVGDEPLLLAAAAPTWIGSDRVASARAAVAAGADLLVMDDGFQNPGLAKTASWLVIDGPAGLGNGRVFPAGPLREPFAAACARAAALVVIGPDEQAVAARASLPVHAAELVLDEATVDRLRGERLLAFAGIGRPEKFFQSLRAAGLDLVRTESFADHHPFNDEDLLRLERCACADRCKVVTTIKDFVRISASRRDAVIPVAVTLRWREPEEVRSALRAIVA